MSKVRRIYVEKKEPYAVAARQLRDDIIGFLAVKGLTGVRKLIRYDVENVSDEVFETACRTVFSEPPVDILYRETIDVPANGHVFSPDNSTRERTARYSACSSSMRTNSL